MTEVDIFNEICRYTDRFQSTSAFSRSGFAGKRAFNNEREPSPRSLSWILSMVLRDMSCIKVHALILLAAIPITRCVVVGRPVLTILTQPADTISVRGRNAFLFSPLSSPLCASSRCVSRYARRKTRRTRALESAHLATIRTFPKRCVFAFCRLSWNFLRPVFRDPSKDRKIPNEIDRTSGLTESVKFCFLLILLINLFNFVSLSLPPAGESILSFLDATRNFEIASSNIV